MHNRPLVAIAIALFVAAGTASVAAANPASQKRVLARLPGVAVEVRAGHTNVMPRPIHAPARVGEAAFGATNALTSTALVPTADIQVTYTGFSAQAQAVFEAAVAVWETQIVSSQVIHVDASWTNLGGGGILGSAGAHNVWLLAGESYVHPSALAEARCSCEVDTVEIEADFNSAFPDWYLGTDGNPPANKYDFFTVVLHELGHGLGFFSSFAVAGANGYWGYSDDGGTTVYPLAFDVNERSAATSGVTLTSAYPNGWLGYTGLKTELTDGSVYFGGTNTVGTLGSRAKLYAPSSWSSGSSNSHFDETSFPTGTQNALMTPFLANGEVIHDPGPLTLALFRDIGWQTYQPSVLPAVSLDLPAMTNSTNVPVTLTATDPAGTGIAGWYLSTSSANPDAGAGGWLASKPTTFNLPAGDGNKTVYAWVKNNAGTVSLAASDTTLLDGTAPTVSISAPSSTSSQTIPITLGGNDGGAGINGWFVSESSSAPAINDSGWKSSKPTSHTLSSGVGTKAVYAWSRDAAGNRSNSASATVQLVNPPDTSPPTVFLPVAEFVAPYPLGSTARVHVSWPPAADASGIASYKLQLKRNSGSWKPVSLPSATATSVDLALVPGSYYRFRLAATDTASNQSAFLTTSKAKLVRAQEKSGAISYSGGGWKRVRLSGASGGYVRRSLTGGSRATYSFSGTSIAFVSTLGPNRGITQLWLDGSHVATVDLYAATLQKARIVWADGLTPGSHTLQVRVTGTKNPSATKSRIDVDAFLVWR
jgi:hypothetical protein